MKIIFAQGNVGPSYTSTRHNIGWAILDAVAGQHGVTFRDQPKFFASIAEYTEGNEKILLVKPTTFYNDSGKAARALLDFYKIEASTDLLVIHDDLALPFGTLRTRRSGRDAGNNGIKSLTAHIGNRFARLRVGIWNELHNRMDDASFVLARFSKEELANIQETVIPLAVAIIEAFSVGVFEETTKK